MISTIQPLRIRRDFEHMSGLKWAPPYEFGVGWKFDQLGDDGMPAMDVLVTLGRFDEQLWIHASIARPTRMPDYEELTMLYRAVFSGPAYQCFVPPAEHIDLHPYALHLWGRDDGERVLPNFGHLGTI